MAEREQPVWAERQLRLREAMRWWIRKSTRAWEHTPWGGGHDEAIFTRTWMTYYMLTGDRTAYDFLDKMAHDFIDCPVVEACKCFLLPEDAAELPDESRRPPYHGYPEDQACFVHAPENYAWFLTHMVHINPSPRIRKALEDCAEHVGNWSPEVPPWYDWQEHRFRSSLFGTGRVRDYPPYDFESLALVRVVVLASNMFYISGETRYLELCVNWADKWARIVLESDSGEGFQTIRFPCAPEEIEAKYEEYARFKEYRAKLDYELANLFLDLYYYLGEESYAQAVHKMLNNPADWIATPDGNSIANGLLPAKYRRLTGDTSFDERIISLADSMILDESDNRPALVLMNKSTEQFLGHPGLAYVRMFRNGGLELDFRRTGLLTLAYLVTGRTSYLDYAMQLALNRFYDSHYIWDGRELGCRGSWQGRNGVAMLNVIPPMMLSATGGFGMLEGERPWYEVRYSHADGTPGLPDSVAALLMPGEPTERTVTFYSAGDKTEIATVTADSTLVAQRGELLKFKAATIDGKPTGDPAQGVRIPPRRTTTLKIEME